MIDLETSQALYKFRRKMTFDRKVIFGGEALSTTGCDCQSRSWRGRSCWELSRLLEPNHFLMHSSDIFPPPHLTNVLYIN